MRGRVEIDVANLGGDFVIVRADGTPLYHFTVVVDDAAMEITHVIRGEDHLSNTPKHILLFRALGHEPPQFAHLPLILNTDRTKMSKRKTQTAIDDYRQEGFIREALVNYLALLGWSTGTEEEVLSLDELIERFDIHEVHKGRRRVRSRAPGVAERPVDSPAGSRRPRRAAAAVPGGRARGGPDRPMPADGELKAILPVIQERLPRLGAVGDLVGFLWVDDVRARSRDARPEALGRGDDLGGPAGGTRHDRGRRTGQSTRPTSWSRRSATLAESRGWKAGDLFMAIRVAVTGRTATPPLFDTLVALGYERTLHRIDRAIDALEGAPAAT